MGLQNIARITIRIDDVEGKTMWEGDLKEILTLKVNSTLLPLADWTEIWVDGVFYANVDYLRDRK